MSKLMRSGSNHPRTQSGYRGSVKDEGEQMRAIEKRATQTDVEIAMDAIRYYEQKTGSLTMAIAIVRAGLDDETAQRIKAY
jgi:3-deoxy-D-arabino-heptulosonate 7-phosphate (DAHP) synthase